MLIFSLDIKTKYQDFHVNLKPNQNLQCNLEIAWFSSSSFSSRFQKVNITQMGENRSLVFNRREQDSVHMYIQTAYCIAISPHKLYISFLNKRPALEKEVKHRDFCWLRDATCFSLNSICFLLVSIFSVHINAKL